MTKLKICVRLPIFREWITKPRRINMSLGSHLQELRNKHEELSRQVETAQKSLGADDLEIGEMKKMKLRLKEEIERMQMA